MVTIYPPRSDDSIWNTRFSEATRESLIQADLEAGRTVTGLLTAIVAGGLLLGIAAVAAIVFG